MTTTPTPNDCCEPTDDLRKKIKGRVDDCVGSGYNPQHCNRIDPKAGYAISPALATVPDLLVATECIKGVECPITWERDKPNYWALAWQEFSENYLKNYRNHIGMAINAKLSKHTGNPTRDHEQLHIHVSCIDKSVQAVLELQDKNIKTQQAHENDWSILQIKDPTGEKRNYRVLKITTDSDLAQYNLFRLVYNFLYYEEYKQDANKAAGNMQYQTLVVAKRPKDPQQRYTGEGFYILNSDTSSLSLNPGGISDGVRLLKQC